MNEVATFAADEDARSGHDWWRGGVIYQIYPRSFQDSNGDGIGDLKGIIQRLHHVAALGVDAIWISPFYRSPMKDYGYDVADYFDVDPIFGTLEDFDDLVAEARRLGLRVIIDLVLSHTSDKHHWFKESRASRDNARADWYVWADAKPDGTPPNNWLSVFGGSAWHWDAQRCQYYLHNFLTSQPDLNFHNEEVRRAMLGVAEFWLERGVGGFRLDTVNFYFHDQQLRDNPALPREMLNESIAPAVNPYNYQEHLYSKNRPENLDFLRRLRALMKPYGAAAVGEVGDAQRGLEIAGQYTTGDDLLNMCYAFELLGPTRPDAERLAEVLAAFDQTAPDGWACWAVSNHDVVRNASRWELSPAAQRLFCTMLMCLRGSVCLYQGEELGLPEAELGYEDLHDPYGKEFWPAFKGRDGCRTPMVWTKADANGGFSQGKPWLPVPAEHLDACVDVQNDDAAALLNHYRRSIRFRQAHEALRTGEHRDIRHQGDVLSFVRVGGQEAVFCAFNMSAAPVDCSLPEGAWRPVGIELGSAGLPADGKLRLEPWQFCLASRRTDTEGSGQWPISN